MNLGEKLQKLRKEHGLSQEELAVKLCVSRQAVSKWELNNTLPDSENIIALSKLFKVSTDYLLNINITDVENNLIQDNENRVNKIFIGSFCVLIVGLLVSFISKYTYVTEEVVIILGLIIQIIGISMFHILLVDINTANKSKTKAKFYICGVWLVMPYISSYIIKSLLLFFYINPYSYYLELLLCAILYFSISIGVSLYFKKNYK